MRFNFAVLQQKNTTAFYVYRTSIRFIKCTGEAVSHCLTSKLSQVWSLSWKARLSWLFVLWSYICTQFRPYIVILNCWSIYDMMFSLMLGINGSCYCRQAKVNFENLSILTGYLFIYYVIIQLYFCYWKIITDYWFIGICLEVNHRVKILCNVFNVDALSWVLSLDFTLFAIKFLGASEVRRAFRLNYQSEVKVSLSSNAENHLLGVTYLAIHVYGICRVAQLQ